MGEKHLLYMAGGAVTVFAVLILSGAPASTALVWGLLSACPLMMIGMMFSMNRGDTHSTPENRADEQGRWDDARDADGQRRSRR
jgi:hypothetical protein